VDSGFVFPCMQDSQYDCGRGEVKPDVAADINIWVSNRQSQSRINSFAYDVTKRRRNRYNDVKSCLLFPTLRSKQLCISVYSIYGVANIFHEVFSGPSETFPSLWCHNSMRLSTVSALYFELTADLYVHINDCSSNYSPFLFRSVALSFR